MSKQIVENLKPKTSSRRWVYPYIAAAILIAIAAFFYINLWQHNSSKWNDYAHEEEIIDFQAGQNFATKGFVQLGFLTDHSLDDAPDAPPVHYTHQPPLPILFIGWLISIGLDTLPLVRLVMIIIFLAGLVALIAFFWRSFSPWHGIAVAGLLILNGRQILPLVDHTTHAWWLILSFLVLWALSCKIESRRFFFIAAAGVFLVSWTNYIQLIVLLVTLGGFWLLRVPNFTLRRVIILFIVATGGIALHIIQNTIVLGVNVTFQDIFTSFGNRIFGEPTREALRAFSQQHNLILWGVGTVGNAVSPLASLWHEYSYFAIPLILSVAGLLLLAFFKRAQSSMLALRILAVFIVASASFDLLLPAAGSAYYFPFMIAIPIATAGGLLVGELTSLLRQYDIRDYWTSTFPVFIRRYGILSIPIILTVFTISKTADIGLRNLQTSSMPPVTAELQILQDFKGEGFWTNITPHQVSYYTHSWVIGQVPLEGLRAMDINQAYVIPVSRLSYTWQKVNNPRYFFFAENNVLWFLPDTGARLLEYRRYLEENYPIVAWSPYRSSFIADMSIGPVGIARITEGRQDFDVGKYLNIGFDATQLNTSSINGGMDKNALVQSGIDGFWHVAMPRNENPAWVTIDLKIPKAAAILRIRPRNNYTVQLWDGNKAALQVSQDGQQWETLSVLELSRTSLKDDWISFPIFSTQRYRYYRLSIYDTSFLSMGRIELYELPLNLPPAPIPVSAPSPAQVPDPDLVPNPPSSQIVQATQQFNISGYNQIPLTSPQLAVSSINSPTMGKSALVLPGTDGFWHLKAPREENPAWLTIDLNTPHTVDVLSLRPRNGYPNQLWDGDSAILYVSSDGQNWQQTAILSINRSSLVDDWVYFSLPPAQQYRYLKLSVGDITFLSIGRLRLYQKSK